MHESRPPSSARKGRPTDNPKPRWIGTRLDEETGEILDAYCDQEDIPRAEGVRRGIRRLKGDIKPR